MRQLLIITTIFLSSLLMASVVHAKWTKVGKSVDGTFYVDLERIKKHSGMVYYWGLVDRSKPTMEISGKIFLISYNRYPFPHPTSRILDLLFNLNFLINFFATGVNLPGINL